MGLGSLWVVGHGECVAEIWWWIGLVVAEILFWWWKKKVDEFYDLEEEG